MKTLKKVQLLVMALIVAIGVSSCDDKKSKSSDDDKEETEKVEKGEETEETEKVKTEFNTGSDVLDEGLRRLNRVCLKGQKADSREELSEIIREFGKVFATWEKENIEILDSVYEIETAFNKFDVEIEKILSDFRERSGFLYEKEKVAEEQNMAELPEVEEDVDVEEFLPPPPPPEEVIDSEEVCASVRDFTLYLYYKAYYYRDDFSEELEDIYRKYITDEKLLEKKLERIYSYEREALKEHDLGQIFTVVDQSASYPGGETALMNWITNNIQYPPMAAEEGAQGRVVVQFVVEKDGSIGDAKIARGVHPELDKEAIRLVKSIQPNFTPGKNNGKPVRCWFTLPINFKLQQ